MDIRKIFNSFGVIGAIILLLLHGFSYTLAHEEVSTIGEVARAEASVELHFFGREDCRFCGLQKEFLNDLVIEIPDLIVLYYDVIDSKEAKELFDQVIAKHELTYVTPTTVIGERVLQGFDSELAAGVRIREAIEAARTSDIKSAEDHLARAPKASEVQNAGGCDEEGNVCGIEYQGGNEIFDLPLIGVVDLETFSLTTLAVVLGFIDGFNPCAFAVIVFFISFLGVFFQDDVLFQKQYLQPSFL